MLSLLGNHEIMNVLGNMKYVDEKGASDFGNYEKRKELFKPGKKWAKYLACTRNSIVKIGDWIFVHGGLLPQWVDNMSIKNLIIK